MIRLALLISFLLQIASAQQAQLSEASQRMRASDYAGARPILETLVKQWPQLPEPHNLLGICLLQLKDPVESLAEFRRAVQIEPHYENAWLNLGSTLFGQDDENGAVAAFDQLLRIHPGSVDAHVALAKIQLARGDEGTALRHLEKVIELDPKNTFALANAGLIESRKGHLGVAANDISRAAAQAPDSSRLRLALVELDLKRGKIIDAETLTRQLIHDDSLNATQKQTLALLLLNNGLPQRGADLAAGDKDLSEQYLQAAMVRAKQAFLAANYKETIGILEAVRTLRSKDAELHDLLGLALYESGDARKASDELQEAIHLEPRNPDWYFQLGLVYLKHHTPDLAEVVFEHGVTELPDSAWLWLGLGISQHFADDTAHAQQSVQKAILLDPGLVEGYVVLGDILETSGRLPEAESVFREAITKRPDLYIGYYYCGKVALEAGDGPQQQALALLTKAVDLNPDFAEAHFERGRALELADKLDQAAAEYRTSLGKNGGLSQAHYRLALLYRKLGKSQAADKEFALFQKAKPSETDAVLKRLEYRIRQP